MIGQVFIDSTFSNIQHSKDGVVPFYLNLRFQKLSASTYQIYIRNLFSLDPMHLHRLLGGEKDPS